MPKDEGTTRLTEREIARLEEATPRQRELLLSLLDVRKGEMLDEMSDQLAEVVQAVEETGKPGSITLSIAIRTGGRGALTVTDDVSSKVPKIDKILTLFFNDGRGGLSRRNPDQAELPLTPMKNDAPVPLRVATRNGEEA
jgi:hypothetical protein